MDLTPLWISLKISFFATLIAFVIGIFAARFVTGLKRGKAVIDSLLALPLVLPPTVVGFLLLILLGQNSTTGRFLTDIGIKWVFTAEGATLAAFVVSFPVMYRGIRGALEQVDEDIIYAARTLGMSEWRILHKVMIPAAMPGIAASVILSFARSLGEFGATLMVAGNIPGKTRTMSIAVYTAMQSGDRETAFKWVAVIMAFSLIILTSMNLLSAVGSGRRGNGT